MTADMMRKLKEAGFTVTSIQGALDLTDEDMEVVELRLVNKRLWEGLRKALDERDRARSEERGRCVRIVRTFGDSPVQRIKAFRLSRQIVAEILAGSDA